MNVAGVLTELFGRIPHAVQKALGDATLEDVMTEPEPGTNPAAWIVWHLSRLQDHHVSEVAGTGPLWVAGGWATRFGLRADPQETGNGHDVEQVRSVRPESLTTLLGYLDAVHDRTSSFLASVTEDDLDRIVDRSYDPGVSAGVRLISVANDNLQHAGQVAYVCGLLRRRRK
jgi:DinB family protein